MDVIDAQQSFMYHSNPVSKDTCTIGVSGDRHTTCISGELLMAFIPQIQCTQHTHYSGLNFAGTMHTLDCLFFNRFIKLDLHIGVINWSTHNSLGSTNPDI